MPRVRAAVLLLAWIALTLGGVAQGAVGEQGWSHLQPYWGQVQSISVDKCGQRPGLCQGTLVLTPQRGREAEPDDQRLFATDTLSQCLRGFHTPENTRLPPSCPVN